MFSKKSSKPQASSGKEALAKANAAKTAGGLKKLAKHLGGTLTILRLQNPKTFQETETTPPANILIGIMNTKGYSLFFIVNGAAGKNPTLKFFTDEQNLISYFTNEKKNPKKAIHIPWYRVSLSKLQLFSDEGMLKDEILKITAGTNFQTNKDNKIKKSENVVPLVEKGDEQKAS